MKKRPTTYEEIKKLSKEEFLEFTLQEQKRVYKSNFIRCLPDNYSELSFDDKVKYWTEALNQGMRLQVEKGHDEYSTFTPQWYKTFREVDPNVDEIMDKVFRTFSKYGWTWDKQEYLKRISTPTL